jgi:sulfocyanin
MFQDEPRINRSLPRFFRSPSMPQPISPNDEDAMPMLTSAARAVARNLFVLLAAAPLFLGALPAAAADAKAPSWAKIDAAAKKVSFDVVAGWNANNGNLNFNGYYDGDATVVVPVGWSAEFDFGNNDAALPHSLLVVKNYAKGEIPTVLGRDQVAIPRAYTKNPESGIAAGETDNFNFRADAPGEYLMVCGAPGHAQAGMFIRLSLSKDAKAPTVTLGKGAAPGRP